jgi:hypothetical protein
VAVGVILLVQTLVLEEEEELTLYCRFLMYLGRMLLESR